MDKDFQDFWEAYHPNELRFPNRKQATYRLWCTRITPTRQAMLEYVRHNKVPEWKNPYFFVQEFIDPDPTNYNGRSFPMGAQMVIAIYNGKGGIYTKADAELYNMTIKKEIEP